MDLAEMIRMHGGSIKRLCRSYEANSEKASDLNQEIWTAIWLSLPKFEARCTLRTWIYRVAHNTAITHVSKEKREKALISIEDMEEQIVDERHSLSQALEHKDALQTIQALLINMKLVDRQVFWLYIEGHSQAEIAAVSGLTATHISTKISRVKKVLETVLKNSESKGDQP